MRIEREKLFQLYKDYAMLPEFNEEDGIIAHCTPYVLFTGNIVFLDKNEPTVVTKDNYHDVVGMMADKIIGMADEKEDILIHLLVFMGSPYRLQFISIISHWLEPEELGDIMRWIWIATEFPHQYSNDMLLLLFEKADQQSLMDEEEWKTFQSLPEEITIYRGRQAKKAKIRGLSWTIDKKQAEWFALRWKNDEGELYSAVINKKDVFAYFSQEKEIVVNPGKIKKLKKIEIGK